MNILMLSDKNLIESIPELQQLRGVVENNSWHKNDDVLDHTFAVFNRLKENLRSNDQLDGYFAQKVGVLNKDEILAWATLFHDIAKPETIETTDAGTKCPNHEEAGAMKVISILPKYIENQADQDRIVSIIRNHQIPHQMMSDKNYDEIQTKYGDIYVELLLLGLSDTQGSQLIKLNPEEYQTRITTYHDLLIQRVSRSTTVEYYY